MICSWLGCLLIASFWTLLEWTRIGWCSGFYFDLVGISLTGHLATLQTASLFGVLGMSWGVLLTNACVLRAYLEPRKTCILAALLLICAPYLYGTWHVMHHSRQMAAFDVVNPPLQTLIVHSKKVPEEFQKQKPKAKTPQERALSCWNDLVQAIAPYKGQTLDLILMPEGVVPYGSTSLLFTRNEIEDLFQTYLQAPLPFNTDDILCSEDVAQLVATLFSCPLVIGLEGIQYPPNSNQARFYNSAFFFTKDPNVAPTRYDKQILVPMGEYIPLDFAKQIAAKYGVYDSFTPGNTPKVFKNGKMVIGPSVCYEETFGNLMRQNSLLGANLLVNLTDDYWFPYSTLAIQHYTHALPRTVENGAPLLRSCNFGISGAIDSLGRPVVAVEGPNEPSSIFTAVSSYHYPTLYSKFGDLPILLLSLGICLTAALIFFIKRK
jgi:apolipoprotein N-acyltransferase